MTPTCSGKLKMFPTVKFLLNYSKIYLDFDMETIFFQIVEAFLRNLERMDFSSENVNELV